MRYEDLTGRRFGRLLVKRRYERESRATYWLCECDCGNGVVVRGGNLRIGKTKSCGCLKNEASSKRITEMNISHGESDSRLYGIWCDMKKRCTNSSHWAYVRYGGRGITFDPMWEKYEIFAEWSRKNGYEDNLTLDRENNDGPYSPNNCRWVTRKVQSRNKSNNTVLEFEGKSLTLAEWAEKLNIPYHTLYGRIHNYGWSIEKALTTLTKKGGD